MTRPARPRDRPLEVFAALFVNRILLARLAAECKVMHPALEQMLCREPRDLRVIGPDLRRGAAEVHNRRS